MREDPLSCIVESLFDYSGMFPPESKSLEAALADSAQFPHTLKRPYLVNTDMVLQRKNIEILTAALVASQGFRKGRVRIAYLGSDVVDAKLKTQLEELDFISDFNGKNAKSDIVLVIVSYEIKISPEVMEHELFLSLSSQLKNDDVLLAVEPDLSQSNWNDTLDRTLSVLSGVGRGVALKIRGTGPAAIDTIKMATVIERIARGEVSVKATGGMHHPIIEKDRYGNNLGFLNFASALIFARVLRNRFPLPAIVDCLNCERSSDYAFHKGLAWKDHFVSLEELKRIKKTFSMSIGSCSLKEPDEDLSRLFG